MASSLPPLSDILVDLSARSKFRLSGPDRERYLNGQVSNQVTLASSEKTIPACVCNLKGKLDGVVQITTTDDGEALLLDGPAALRESLFLRLDRYLIADDCELEDVTEDIYLVHALGSPPDLPGYSWRQARRFGPVGHDAWLDAAAFDRLTPPGRDLVHPSTTGLETLRIRHGIPRWGAELDETVLPAEAGLDREAIDFHKGCYLGQEVISRIESVGRVNRSLRLLAVDDPTRSPSPGDGLFPANTSAVDGKPVGSITSTSPDGAWALAHLRRDWDAPETKLVSATSDGKLPRIGLEVRTFESSGE